MTAKTDKPRRCIFQWQIKNISHCWLNKKMISSPKFIVKGTEWVLEMYPTDRSYPNFIGFYLYREDHYFGSDFMKVNFQLALLDKDGSVRKEVLFLKQDFGERDTIGLSTFEERRRVFVSEREVFLPEDTLTVQCTIWNADEKYLEPERLYAQTVFKLKRRNFMMKIEKFSTLTSGIKHTFKDNLTEFDLVLKEGLGFEKNLAININFFDESIKYFSFKVSVVNSSGKMENFGTHEYFADDLKKEVLCTLLFIKKLMENKTRYLPNDVLSLDCEYTYSNGIVSSERCGCGIILPKLTNKTVEIGNQNNMGNEKSQIASVMANDLKFMYKDKIFSDTELRTSTQIFSAHKNILSARSPVFRRMFSNDMKENRGHVDIIDLEDDTVNQMLLYIYTDTLDDMNFDSAFKLYLAADKYEILSLRSSCSSFLKDNLCSDQACDVLGLADQHQDDDLKCAVQDFILKHGKEVFGSLEWKHFMVNNIQLASDTMYQFTQCKIHEP